MLRYLQEFLNSKRLRRQKVDLALKSVTQKKSQSVVELCSYINTQKHRLFEYSHEFQRVENLLFALKSDIRRKMTISRAFLETRKQVENLTLLIEKTFFSYDNQMRVANIAANRIKRFIRALVRRERLNI